MVLVAFSFSLQKVHHWLRILKCKPLRSFEISLHPQVSEILQVYCLILCGFNLLYRWLQSFVCIPSITISNFNLFDQFPASQENYMS